MHASSHVAGGRILSACLANIHCIREMKGIRAERCTSGGVDGLDAARVVVGAPVDARRDRMGRHGVCRVRTEPNLVARDTMKASVARIGDSIDGDLEVDPTPMERNAA